MHGHTNYYQENNPSFTSCLCVIEENNPNLCELLTEKQQGSSTANADDQPDQPDNDKPVDAELAQATTKAAESRVPQSQIKQIKVLGREFGVMYAPFIASDIWPWHCIDLSKIEEYMSDPKWFQDEASQLQGC
jgi:hypothetical protein